jgi:hypothetical protein
MAIKIVYRSPSDLWPQPLNEQLYGPPKANSAYETIEFKMRHQGFDDLYPLQITQDGRIVDGVTRWALAKKLRLESVPCVLFVPSSEETAELEIQQQLIIANSYRIKTRLMAARELRKLVELETARAKKRMQWGKGDDGVTGKATERAAKLCKTSGATVQRTLRVLAGIDAATERGDERMTVRLTELLERGKTGIAEKLIAEGKGESKRKARIKKAADVPRTGPDHAMLAYREFYEACAKTSIKEELPLLEKYLKKMQEALETARDKLSHTPRATHADSNRR